MTNISRFVTRPALNLVFATCLLFGVGNAFATSVLSYIECPSWSTARSGYIGSAENAAKVFFQHPMTISEIGASCAPIVLGTCGWHPAGNYRRDCIGFDQCARTFHIEAVGSGVNLLGTDVITSGNPNDTNRIWCARWMDSAVDDGKNVGGAGDHCPYGPFCGNPVNIATGNKFQVETDYPSQGDGTLEFVRYYNSILPFYESGIGRMWTHTWSRKLAPMGTAIMMAYRPDAKVYTFRLVSGVWTSDADVPYVLTPDGTGWKLITGKNETELYSSEGRLTSVVSPSGKITTLEYSDGTASGPYGGVSEGTTNALAIGTLLRVIDYRGRKMQFFYNQRGNLARMVDPAGQTYLYAYNADIALETVTYPGTVTRVYVYNESANTSGNNYPIAMTGITDENGARFATFKYDNSRRAISSEHAGGVEKYQFSYGSTLTTTDPLGTTLTSPWTAILGVKQPTGRTRSCTGCGPATTESVTLDANRNRTTFKDYNGNLTCYTFGSRNLEAVRTEGLSGTGTCASRVTTTATRTITSEWHATWRLPKRVAEPLKLTSYSYHGESGVSCAPTGASTTLLCSKSVQATTDADGSLGFSATSDGAARTTSWTYNVDGQVLSIDGPRTDVSDSTSFTYYTADDAGGKYRKGDLAGVTNAAGHVTQFTEYDSNGRLLKSIDPNGLETILEYWPRGWLKTRKLGTSAAGYEVVGYEYDSVGQLKKVTQPDASYVQYTYDNAHRLTDIQDGLGNKIHYTLDNMGNRTAEESYDPSLTLVRAHSRVIDGLNRVWKDVGGTTPSTQVTQNGFDANGNLTSVLDPLSRTTLQDFDPLNRLKAVKDPFNGTTHPTQFAYNGQSMLTQVTDPAGLSTTYTLNGHGETIAQSSPDTGSTSFTFDAASNLKTKLDARGISANYSYDALNRVTQIVYPDETVTYTWDSCANGKGRLCSISDNSGTTTYTLDLWGRVTGKSQTVAGVTQSMGYAFNSAGQLSTVTTPSGRSVAYGYSNNRPVSVTVNGVSVLSGVTYEAFGPNGGWVWGNSASNTHTRVFDKDFRATRVTSDQPTSGSQPYFDKKFNWDVMSRISSIEDLANSALNASYGFDALDRLSSATQGSSSWGYTYNGVGDRLTSTVGAASTTYAYQASTHRLTSLSGAQSKTFTVDAAGNMTGDGSTTWIYGGNNRPTSAGSTTFLINALGQRVKKTTGSSSIRFVYDESGRLWGEYDGTGALIQEIVWLEDLPVAVLRANGAGTDIYYVHSDQLGTPRAITLSSDNQFVWKWDNTEAFGNSAPNDNPSGLGTFAFNLRFPGQYWDSETGTSYNYFRTYDPSIGRYIQSDPIGLSGGINTYAYVKGQPLTLTDPFGLDSRGGGGGGGGDGQSGDDSCELIQQVGPVGFKFPPGMPFPLVKMLCVYKCWTLCASYKVAAFQWIWNPPYNCAKSLKRREIHD
jgi:RHS repeat-associated protein